MSLPHQRTRRRKSNGVLQAMPLRKLQCGVVLIIALVLLVVVSLLAATTVRNSGSNEAVAGNVRTVELATEAAEIALRHCEASVLKVLGGNDAYVTTFAAVNILTGIPTQWQLPANWDKKTPAVYALPLPLLNQLDTPFTYKRPPECMVEEIPSASPVKKSTFYLVTARGFGPEVAEADENRSRPVGTEIWLQSHIEIQ